MDIQGSIFDELNKVEEKEDTLVDGNLEDITEIAKSPYKTILQQFEGIKGWRGYYLHNVAVADDKESLVFIYKYGKYDFKSSPVRKSQLEDDPIINEWIKENSYTNRDQILIRQTEVTIATIIFELFDEGKVYTLEELIKKGISIKDTPVKIEDLSLYTDEEFYHKQRFVWDVLHASERFYRWNKPQPEEQLIIRGYNQVILYSLFELLVKDGRRRGRLAAIDMSDETAKGHAIKWLYSDRQKDLINSGNQSALAKSLVHEYSGGTLCGDYNFFIGGVTCTRKGISIALYPDMENYCVEKCTMTYKEAASRLIKKYRVRKVEELTIESKITQEHDYKELTLFTITDEDIEVMKQSTKKNSNKLVNGQLSLFAV